MGENTKENSLRHILFMGSNANGKKCRAHRRKKLQLPPKGTLCTLCLCEIINSYYFFPISSFLLTLYLSPFFLCQFSSFLLSSFIHWQFIFSATTTNVSQYPEWKSKGASTTPDCVSRGHVYFSLGTNGQTKLWYDSFMFMFMRFTMFASC